MRNNDVTEEREHDYETIIDNERNERKSWKCKIRRK